MKKSHNDRLQENIIKRTYDLVRDMFERLHGAPAIINGIAALLLFGLIALRMICSVTSELLEFIALCLGMVNETVFKGSDKELVLLIICFLIEVVVCVWFLTQVMYKEEKKLKQ